MAIQNRFCFRIRLEIYNVGGILTINKVFLVLCDFPVWEIFNIRKFIEKFPDCALTEHKSFLIRTYWPRIDTSLLKKRIFNQIADELRKSSGSPSCSSFIDVVYNDFRSKILFFFALGFIRIRLVG
jgi:hypothetical protein